MLVRQYNANLWQSTADIFSNVDLTDDPIDWIQGNFYIPETMAPIVLAPYQIGVLKEAYRRDRNGRFVYRLVVWSDLKKSAKSTIAAAVVLERARRTRFGSFKIVANDLKQADSRVAAYFRRSLQLAEMLDRPVEGVYQRGMSTHFANYASVEAVPIDPAGEAGGNDDMIVFSELWAATTEKQQRMWTEMTLSPLKDGQRWVETYAGIKGKSPLLEPIYDRLVQPQNKIDVSYTDADGNWVDLRDLEVYSDGFTLCLWNTIPGRHWWQTADYYAAEEEALLPEEFVRVHKNRFSVSQDQFVPGEWVDNCVVRINDDPDQHWLTISPRDPMVLAADAGVNDDTFGLVLSRNVNGRSVIVYAKKWTAPKEGKIDFVGTKTEPGPELEIKRLLAKYRVTEVRYDPYQLHSMMTRLSKLKKHRRTLFVEFPQQGKRAIADRNLYTLIKERRLLIPHGNADLVLHLKNADRSNVGDNKLRLVKRNKDDKIDLAVATSMATYSDDSDKKEASAGTRKTGTVKGAWQKSLSTGASTTTNSDKKARRFV